MRTTTRRIPSWPSHHWTRRLNSCVMLMTGGKTGTTGSGNSGTETQHTARHAKFTHGGKEVVKTGGDWIPNIWDETGKCFQIHSRFFVSPKDPSALWKTVAARSSREYHANKYTLLHPSLHCSIIKLGEVIKLHIPIKKMQLVGEQRANSVGEQRAFCVGLERAFRQVSATILLPTVYQMKHWTATSENLSP